MTLRAHHLPGFAATDAGWTLEQDGVRVTTPQLSADDIHTICDALLDARAQLERTPVQVIIQAIDDTTRRLRDRGAPDYAQLIRGIAAFTGYSSAMAEHVLERMSADWLAAPLERLVRAELGSFDAVDAFATLPDGRRARAISPPLTLHIFSGNVPGVSVTSIVRALLVKSAVLGKSAAGEPLLAARFAQLLAEVNPVIGACVAVTYWTGGTADIENAALERADAVIHYGSAAAIASLRARAPERLRFIEHGPRISFCIINGTIVDGDAGAAAARALAHAVALFEQQGCVSPQVAYVVCDHVDIARRFAARVAAALEAVQHEFPRGRIDAAEANAVRQLRTSAEFRAIRGADVQLWAGDNLAWTVVLDDTPKFAATCLNRTLLVKHVASTSDVIAHVSPFGSLLQTVGVAGYDGSQRSTLAAALGAAGATRIANIADMPWPPISWHHDGRGPLTELIRWVDFEL